MIKSLREILSEVLLILLLASLLCGFRVSPAGSSETHDVAIINVVSWPLVSTPAGNIYINVTVENQGASNESFTLSVYLGNITVREMSVHLIPGQIKTVELMYQIPGIMWALVFQPPLWDTNPMIEDLTVWAEASVVAGEVDTSDNVYVDGSVTVIWWIGDANGDGRCDIFDMVIIAGSYGSEPGDPEYHPLVDFNQNGAIDIFDIVAAAGFYGTIFL
ncbi:MAG: hypothetical protein JSV64_00030 [Candidatus Bathyarchaeota archaeon]|nr:MAG: hypothetical protein JSV64_00030 [Candidatus Bathyarchaeota archaeon]